MLIVGGWIVSNWISNVWFGYFSPTSGIESEKQTSSIVHDVLSKFPNNGDFELSRILSKRALKKNLKNYKYKYFYVYLWACWSNKLGVNSEINISNIFLLSGVSNSNNDNFWK